MAIRAQIKQESLQASWNQNYVLCLILSKHSGGVHIQNHPPAFPTDSYVRVHVNIIVHIHASAGEPPLQTQTERELFFLNFLLYYNYPIQYIHL